MISGQLQRPTIPVAVKPLVRFYKSGYNAYFTSMVCAVEMGMTARQILTIYFKQEPLIKRIYDETTQLHDKGWGAASEVFGRNDALTPEERWRVRRFRDTVANQEYRLFIEEYGRFRQDRNFERFARYARNTYRLFPSLTALFRNIAIKYLLDASERRISIHNAVESPRQFASPDIHLNAKALFDSLAVHSMQRSKDGGVVDIYGDDVTVAFQYKYEGRGEDEIDQYMLWETIKENLVALNWNMRFIQQSGGKTEIQVTMSEDSFDTPGRARRRRKTTQRLKRAGTISYTDLLQAADVPFGRQLFLGYRLMKNGSLDLTPTPIYQCIEATRRLYDPIANALRQPLG